MENAPQHRDSHLLVLLSEAYSTGGGLLHSHEDC